LTLERAGVSWPESGSDRGPYLVLSVLFAVIATVRAAGRILLHPELPGPRLERVGKRMPARGAEDAVG
jgi:hypothetical protein